MAATGFGHLKGSLCHAEVGAQGIRGHPGRPPSPAAPPRPFLLSLLRRRAARTFALSCGIPRAFGDPSRSPSRPDIDTTISMANSMPPSGLSGSTDPACDCPPWTGLWNSRRSGLDMAVPREKARLARTPLASRTARSGGRTWPGRGGVISVPSCHVSSINSGRAEPIGSTNGTGAWPGPPEPFGGAAWRGLPCRAALVRAPHHRKAAAGARRW